MKTSSAPHVVPACLVALHLKFTCFALFQWMVSWKPSESTVNLCNMWKISEIASAHSWNIIFENFVRRIEEVAGQSVRQLKIFISRLGCTPTTPSRAGKAPPPLFHLIMLGPSSLTSSCRMLLGTKPRPTSSFFNSCPSQIFEHCE